MFLVFQHYLDMQRAARKRIILMRFKWGIQMVHAVSMGTGGRRECKNKERRPRTITTLSTKLFGRKNK
jgi:hypothetical protein